MGQAVVISRSLKLLRLLLKLTEEQWAIWCKSFENIGRYTFDRNEYEHLSVRGFVSNSAVKFYKCFVFKSSEDKLFCEALTLMINAINIKKICDLELKCAKMWASLKIDEGMPKWFCLDAKERHT